MTDDSHDSIDDAIGDILLETAEKPLSNPLTLPAPMSSVQTPAPVSAGTPGPIMTKTPAPLMTKTPAPLKLGTPGPVLTKTPAPLTSRDPSSALPSIPAPTKEPSGAFPLPGMAPEAGKISDDDVTLIARLSVLDDLAEEPTKVEAIDDVLRATSAKEEPIALADQATAERDRALGVSAVERMSAAEFEDPGDDEDEMTVSATPGIISISEEDEDDDEPTASQRPPSARKTPTPATGGPRLSTPAPLSHLGGAPRLPAPTPPPGRTMHLPTPSGGLPSIPMPLVSQPSSPQRALTPALPIPAPLGAPSTVSAARSAIFNKVQLPLGGLVAFFAAAFGAGVVFGGWMWGRQPVAPTPVAAEAPASATTVAKTPPTPEAEPTPVAPPTPVAAEPKAAPAIAEPKAPPVIAEPKAAEPTPTAPTPKEAPVHHAVVAKPRPLVHKPVAAPAAVAAKPAAPKPVAAAVAKPVTAAAKPATPAVAKPATPAAKPTAKPLTASAKPAPKTDKAKAKAWVDPFAE